MGYNVLITPEAGKQVEQAVEYCGEHVSKKVALDFLKDYRRAVSEIMKVRYFQVFYLNFRARLMKKFPYLVDSGRWELYIPFNLGQITPYKFSKEEVAILYIPFKSGPVTSIVH